MIQMAYNSSSYKAGREYPGNSRDGRHVPSKRTYRYTHGGGSGSQSSTSSVSGSASPTPRSANNQNTASTEEIRRYMLKKWNEFDAEYRQQLQQQNSTSSTGSQDTGDQRRRGQTAVTEMNWRQSRNSSHPKDSSPTSTRPSGASPEPSSSACMNEGGVKEAPSKRLSSPSSGSSGSQDKVDTPNTSDHFFTPNPPASPSDPISGSPPEPIASTDMAPRFEGSWDN